MPRPTTYPDTLARYPVGLPRGYAKTGAGEAGLHFRYAATLSIPAWEHSSSRPGDPDTPTAPTISSPTLIGKPPDIASTRLYSLEPTEAGSFSIRLTKSADGCAERPRGAGLAVGAFRGVKTRTITPQHHYGQTGAIDHDHRNLEAQFLALIHRGFSDRFRHRQRDVLFAHQALRARARAQRRRARDSAKIFRIVVTRLPPK